MKAQWHNANRYHCYWIGYLQTGYCGSPGYYFRRAVGSAGAAGKESSYGFGDFAVNLYGDVTLVRTGIDGIESHF